MNNNYETAFYILDTCCRLKLCYNLHRKEGQLTSRELGLSKLHKRI